MLTRPATHQPQLMTIDSCCLPSFFARRTVLSIAPGSARKLPLCSRLKRSLRRLRGPVTGDVVSIVSPCMALLIISPSSKCGQSTVLSQQMQGEVGIESLLPGKSLNVADSASSPAPPKLPLRSRDRFRSSHMHARRYRLCRYMTGIPALHEIPLL